VVQKKISPQHCFLATEKSEILLIHSFKTFGGTISNLHAAKANEGLPHRLFSDQ
jgi:hypothetical protein